jgi:hypothetical protein
MPNETSHLRPVTREEFFAFMGPRDVHPRVEMATLKTPAIASTWETRNRVVVGRSISPTVGKSEYFLSAAKA